MVKNISSGKIETHSCKKNNYLNSASAWVNAHHAAVGHYNNFCTKWMDESSAVTTISFAGYVAHLQQWLSQFLPCNPIQLLITKSYKTLVELS